MKRLKGLALLLCLLLLCACSAEQGGGEVEQDTIPNTQEEQEERELIEPIYGFEEVTQSRQFTDESSGELYASYSYRMPMMHIVAPDKLSEEELAVAERNVEAFNTQMQLLMENAVAFGEELALGMEGCYSPLPAADEKTMTVSQAGEIITVFANGYYYSGGAHPYVYVDSYTFDLTVGSFIDPAQIGDDPETFRVQAAALLVAQAESLGEDYTSGYWDDYAEIIANWNDAAVLFDENGMTVTFSPYELGPYAMGFVELFLTYEELADVIGEGGLKHLGAIETDEA